MPTVGESPPMQLISCIEDKKALTAQAAAILDSAAAAAAAADINTTLSFMERRPEKKHYTLWNFLHALSIIYCEFVFRHQSSGSYQDSR